MRGPVEPGQYTSFDYTQQLDDAKVLASVGSVGDCFDNAMAESLVDSYKTELIRDRVWRTRTQLELSTIEWVGWYNHDRLHEALGDIPPVEFEAAATLNHAISANGSVAGTPPRAADRLRTRRVAVIGVDFAAQRSDLSVNAPAARNGLAQAPTAVKGRNASVGLSDLRLRDILTDRQPQDQQQLPQEST